MSDKSWTEEFFFEWPPPEWINAVYDDRQVFRPFSPPQGKWVLGRSVGTGRRPSQDQIQVLWLLVQHDGMYMRKYVAKVFPGYTEENAYSQLRRVPPRIPKKLQGVKDELDPYTNEARVYSRINALCPSSQRIYFPEFHGVMTDLDISKFTCGYVNRRAVILELIRPRLASRRILAACTERNLEFKNRLSALGFLSVFELEYYISLFHDRIRRLLALHRLGITHGDVRDDHFRLSGDFHDTVLYDFSVSYTFSPVTPYLINFRRPRSLKDISESEQAMVREDIIERAEKLDFREYLVKSTGSTESAIVDALFQPLEDEILELIILRVKFRPDVFSMPSVNSVFPFLECLCPTDDCTWHIRRGRLLESYTPIWVMSIADSSGQTVMDFTSDRNCAQNREDAKVRYLLCLIPKKWGLEGVRSPLVSICSSLPRNDHGCIKTWLDFTNYI
ncbi:hypothetical protein ANOM_001014 [Aspergillus nomiae NRRL 13137]|uniref:Protein kinase domain-containing protein n=1 Tax=Aspergillus nomiae NRRL (strain ATCC 15546 / NRRL 13137 / CBS 260.88 / M93) TaxID=1509407 RepID=A0A0L1JF57_ASPN3|nr:uncharacterized protein ANOM_001014 [Aspergillus nomiae NRRL 13137]KNG90420.1 hypothetical protein ANOM_001014 [Aspergillus nomiae NRRL 13137]